MKKILAIILSLMLIMSMGAVAFATQTETTYTDQTTVTIKKNYKLIGNGTSPAETFTLTQVGDGVVKNGDATAAPALGTITGAEFAAGAASTAGGQASITIAFPTYTTVGVYEYTLREVAGRTAGVAYHAEDIKLVVTVINGADGKLRIAGVHTEGAGETEKSDEFDNTYSAGTLKVTKTVAGILGDKDKYFEFTVKLTGDTENKEYATSYAITGGSHAENTGKTVTVGGDAVTFYLKDGETVSIENLPYGVGYTVTEKDYSDEEYVTTKTGEVGTIDAAEKTAAYTNTKGGTPDTGVFVDSLPYILIIAFVAFGGVAMMIKRRRNAEI